MKAVKLLQEIKAAGEGGMLVDRKGYNYNSCCKLHQAGRITIQNVGKCILVKEVQDG